MKRPFTGPWLLAASGQWYRAMSNARYLGPVVPPPLWVSSRWITTSGGATSNGSYGRVTYT